MKEFYCALDRCESGHLSLVSSERIEQINKYHEQKQKLLLTLNDCCEEGLGKKATMKIFFERIIRSSDFLKRVAQVFRYILK